jgi:hypothetical protein
MRVLPVPALVHLLDETLDLAPGDVLRESALIHLRMTFQVPVPHAALSAYRDLQQSLWEDDGKVNRSAFGVPLSARFLATDILLFYRP